MNSVKNDEKSKVIILIGESCSGKDTMLDVLSEELLLHKAISYTTRKPRENEIDGKEYHFLKTNKEFNKLIERGLLFEKTEYDTKEGLLLYGLGKDSFVDDETNITIVNPHGLDQLLKIEELKDRLIVFYITAKFKTRFFRYLNRDGEVEDKHKIALVERFIRDSDDFKNFDMKYGCMKLRNDYEYDMDTCVKKIIKFMERYNK